jgi:hypothetical protein
MKRYSIRKSGTRKGLPTYSAECNLHGTPRVLNVGGISKDTACAKVAAHMRDVHGLDISPK